MANHKQTERTYKLTPLQRIVEVARPWLMLAIYVVMSALHIWWLAVPVAFATVLSAFIQMHDAMHSSLGLSKRNNDAILTLSALLMLKSGHAVRVLHLRHHGSCMTDKDPEGAPANWSLGKVLLVGPFYLLALRVTAFRMAKSARKIQLLETALTCLALLGFVALCFWAHSIAGLVYWGAVFVYSSLMPLLGSYIPHNLPADSFITRIGLKIAGTMTPLISTTSFHHLHHDHPSVPTALLPKAAKEMTATRSEHSH